MRSVRNNIFFEYGKSECIEWNIYYIGSFKQIFVETNQLPKEDLSPGQENLTSGGGIFFSAEGTKNKLLG